MQSPTREFVRFRSGLVALAVATALAALGALGWVVVGSVSSAQGYDGNRPLWAICGSASVTNMAVLEASFGPSDGATVTAGTPVTFSGNSGSQVKGGPGICQGHCSRAHHIWSHAGSGGPSIEQEAGGFWHEVKCGVAAYAQLGAEQTTIGGAMAERGELKRRKC